MLLPSMEVIMSMIRCPGCERQIDTDFVEITTLNNKHYCQTCSEVIGNFVEELKMWIDKNSFTDFGNKDEPKGKDLECIYVDEILARLEEL